MTDRSGDWLKLYNILISGIVLPNYVLEEEENEAEHLSDDEKIYNQAMR